MESPLNMVVLTAPQRTWTVNMISNALSSGLALPD